MMPVRPIIVMFCAIAAFDARTMSAQGSGDTHVAGAATVPAATAVLVDGKPIGAAETWGAKPTGAYDVVLPMPDRMMIHLVDRRRGREARWKAATQRRRP